MKTLLSAINELEEVALPKGGVKTTEYFLSTVTEKERRGYYTWLRKQAPVTASMLPRFEDLVSA